MEYSSGMWMLMIFPEATFPVRNQERICGSNFDIVPFSWFGKVEYRTRRSGAGEVETRGDFRVPLLFFRVATEFRGTKTS